MSRRATLRDGDATLIGFGRMAFAYDDFARDMIAGEVSQKQSLHCLQQMHGNHAGRAAQTGCPIRDQEIYLPHLSSVLHEKITTREVRMTEPYAVLAGFYDRLMEDTDYGAWVSFYLRCFEKFGIRPEKILDLACGTGNITLPLAAHGYDMTRN